MPNNTWLRLSVGCLLICSFRRRIQILRSSGSSLWLPHCPLSTHGSARNASHLLEHVLRCGKERQPETTFLAERTCQKPNNLGASKRARPAAPRAAQRAAGVATARFPHGPRRHAQQGPSLCVSRHAPCSARTVRNFRLKVEIVEYAALSYRHYSHQVHAKMGIAWATHGHKSWPLPLTMPLPVFGAGALGLDIATPATPAIRPEHMKKA